MQERRTVKPFSIIQTTEKLSHHPQTGLTSSLVVDPETHKTHMRAKSFSSSSLVEPVIMS